MQYVEMACGGSTRRVMTKIVYRGMGVLSSVLSSVDTRAIFSTMTTIHAKQPVEMAFAREAKLVMIKMGTTMMAAVNPVQLRSDGSQRMASIPVQRL